MHARAARLSAARPQERHTQADRRSGARDVCAFGSSYCYCFYATIARLRVYIQYRTRLPQHCVLHRDPCTCVTEIERERAREIVCTYI